MHAFVFEVNDALETASCAEALVSVCRDRNTKRREKGQGLEFALFYTKDGENLLAMDGLFSTQTTKRFVLKNYDVVTPIGSMAFLRKWVGSDKLRYMPIEFFPNCLIDRKQRKIRKMVICKGKHVSSKTKHMRSTYVYVFLLGESKVQPAIIRRGRDGKRDMVSAYGKDNLQKEYLFVEDKVYLSEWRYFVMDGEVQYCRCFRGDEQYKPDKSKVDAYLEAIVSGGELPPSFIVDIGVADIANTKPLETLVMGVAPFICCNLYGSYFETLPEMAEKSFSVIA